MKKKINNRDGFSILMDFSHEIRNPLNGISGLTNILMDSSLNSEQKSLVKNIQRNSIKLNDILELMLNYSKLINGMIQYTPEQVFIYPFLQKELDKVFKTYRSNRIKFCYYIPPHLNGIAVFDPYVLSQIINLSVNLIPQHRILPKIDLEVSTDEKNVIFKYQYIIDSETKTEEDLGQFSSISELLLVKYLELFSGELSAKVLENKEELIIQVPIKCSLLDVNIPKVNKNHLLNGKNLILFNYQADTCESTSRYLEYLGINLIKEERSINDFSEGDLDKKHHLLGIDISLLNKQEFQIMDQIRKISQLPLIMFKEADRTEQRVLTLQKDVVVMYKPVSPNNLSYVLESVIESKADNLREWIKNPISVLADYHNSLKILIADDESINQRVLREYLTKLHLKADFVSDGKKAVELYEDNKYDLIFMDIQMPLMDGVESTKQIRNIKNNHHPYIVSITADTLKGGKEKYRSVGMNDFLLKPVSLEGITKIIQKYIEQIKH